MISWIDFLGYGASLAVLATFCMSTMITLRLVAIASNVLFCLYGLFDHLYPVLLLHMTLLPINVFKLAQIRLQTRAVAPRARTEQLPARSNESIAGAGWPARAGVAPAGAPRSPCG